MSLQDEVGESILLEIFTLVRDTHDEPDSSDDDEEGASKLKIFDDEELQKVQTIQARVRGNRVRTGKTTRWTQESEEKELLAEALAGHPGGVVEHTGDSTTITPHQLQVFLRTWIWRTLAFDLGWRLHDVGLLI
jgi:hypothetical protein|eukprot:COSAG02_NODE_2032_length_10063_cov_11.627057_5_plen_134_part_00